MTKHLPLKKNALGRLELHCPHCGEELNAADIENFSRCPFCNQPLPQGAAIEDFILDPVIRGWMRKNPLNNGR